jgi:16S rRNA (guanine(966)-N(2))-methyltransferase RsmD
VPRAPRPGTAQGPGEVRLIAGIWKRSRLRVLSRPGLRPTPDRVRETLFNWLGTDLSGWRVLDAFAGSGALGFEAASRGADQVVMLDQDPAVVRELLAAHQRLHAPDSVHIIRAHAVDWMARCPAGSFELVFIDPPFGADLAEQAAAQAVRLLVPGGWLVIESPEPLAPPVNGVQTRRQLRAGAVFVELRQLPENGSGMV